MQTGHVALGHHTIGMNGETERREVGKGCRLHAGQFFYASQQLAVEFDCLGTCIAHRVQVERGEQNIVGIKAGIGVLRIPQTADEEAGTGEQQQ